METYFDATLHVVLSRNQHLVKYDDFFWKVLGNVSNFLLYHPSKLITQTVTCAYTLQSDLQTMILCTKQNKMCSTQLTVK